MLKSAKILGRSLFISYKIILYSVIILAVFANYPYIVTLAIPNVLQNAPSTGLPDHPPVANAGKNQIVNESTAVILSGLGFDPDLNNTLSYSWIQISGPLVSLHDSNTTNPSFKAPNVSTDTDLKFSLTVRDDKGGIGDPAYVTITVKHFNQGPIANAGKNQTVNPGYVVSLDGTRSKDPDNDKLNYSWQQVGGLPVKLDYSNSAVATFVAPSNITKDTDLTFRLNVTDNKNGTDNSLVKIAIKLTPAPNQNPVANSGSDQTVNSGDKIRLDGSISKDPDGNISSYSWKQIAGPSVTLNDANTMTPSFSAPTLSSDTELKFSLTVTDDMESTSNPSIVTVTVKPIQQPSELQSESQSITTSSGNGTISTNETSVPSVPNKQLHPEVSTEYSFVTKWGSWGNEDGQFDYPQGIATDTSGNVYVADSGNHRIQKFDSNGDFITKWGSKGTGDGQFDYPTGIAADSSGNVYVTDTNNHRLQKFDSNGDFITTLGSLGSGDGQFALPKGVATDSSDNVYVASSSNDRIQKFDKNGNFVTYWRASGIRFPQSIAIDSSDNVYVAGDRLIQKFDINGNVIAEWADRQFSGSDIATGSSDNVYVGEFDNDLIQKFDSDGKFITKWGSTGDGDGQFSKPSAVATDSSGYVYVADSYNKRIQKFAPTN